jgi:hypothetical protein
MRSYKYCLQRGGCFVGLGVVVGTFFWFLLGVFNPNIVNKAGADWMWSGGRDDLIRNLYFKPDGAFRRYGKAGLLATLFLGSAGIYFLFG